MAISLEESFYSTIKFFALLLEQFRGTEGEVAMATAYLTQAVADESPQRRAAFIRIAREKLNHAEMLGAILLLMANGVRGPLSVRANRDELKVLLQQKDSKKNNFNIAECIFNTSVKSDGYSSIARHHAANPKHYLFENIRTETMQIAIYDELVGLTDNKKFITTLNYVKSRQLQHRGELIDLLRRIS
ncbi:manganese catalase family protein [Pseudomonas sp. CCI1.2]|uniref:manganese catalase family protein n=1 Tax=Pseudomonas sp. CCI1.2 TaxID=3048614 RepID=UPI002B232642|nr:manganese catalase family protein [Pseudomonas sp. CCI1.2]MEB0122591.1 manganese catalase family protein [Pseudomonas sp. CCI1.2]